MTDPRAKYQTALAAFAQPGARWCGLNSVTYWGAACGMTADEVVADARAAGVTDRDADIRRGVATAERKVAAFAQSRTRTGGGSARRSGKPKPTPPKPPSMVRGLIEAGRDVATLEALREMSPEYIYPADNTLHRRLQTEIHLQLLFGLSDVVHIRGGKADRAIARPGVTLRTVADWLTKTETRQIGEIVRPNPFTGEQGMTTEGRPSYACKATVAAYRHMVFEFDEMPLADQCRFWAGVIRRGVMPLVSLTHSGGKSIHGVVRFKMANADEWAQCKAMIIERYAADPDPRYRLDAQALDPLTGTRLAGAVRRDTGKVQELLYDCGERFGVATERQRV